ncbi:MAG TPA: cold shock domain-containing protein [Phycisphaerales bacterium]|nr:cold shock domain-containing protein [Phycisphaerales bacterium]
MAKGTVKWFDPKKGFGFVVSESGEDVFVHYSSIHAEGFRCLRSGQRVEYHPIQTQKGLKARTVRLLQETDSNNTITLGIQNPPPY